MSGDTAVLIRAITIMAVVGLVIGVAWTVVVRLLDWPKWMLYADAPVAFYVGFRFGQWHRRGAKP